MAKEMLGKFWANYWQVFVEGKPVGLRWLAEAQAVNDAKDFLKRGTKDVRIVPGVLSVNEKVEKKI